MLEVLQLFFAMFFLIVVLGIFIAAVFFTFQVCIRLWENKVTPWLDEHLGDSGDW